MNKILVATDFSPSAENATKHAASMAKKANINIVLLHIKNAQTAGLLKNIGIEVQALDAYMSQRCKELTAEWGIGFEFKIREGSIFNDINAEAAHPEYQLLVLGIHGTKGLRQKLFGADLLKIARKCPLPLLAIPEEATFSQQGYRTIIFPFGGHTKFEKKVKATAFLAGVYSSEVQFYTIDRFKVNMSPGILRSIQDAAKYMEEQGVTTKMVHDEMKEFSVGFSNRTLQYAKEVKAEVIAVMSIDSPEFSNISAVDKENLINNTSGICILLTADM